MQKKIYSVIIGSGSYVPELVAGDDYYKDYKFYDETNKLLDKPTSEIISKLKDISGIEERRIAPENQHNHDLAYEASLKAIEDANIDPESIDYIIFGHNFGNNCKRTAAIDILPNLSSRLKNKLKIKKPECMCFDILCGCPSFVQSFIMADTLIKVGKSKRVLIVGGDTTSRVTDPSDRDTMLFGDGACALILEAKESEKPIGVISCTERADTGDRELGFLTMGDAFNKELSTSYLKMEGRKLYNYAVSTVPKLVAKNIKEAGIDISDVKKIFIHQANNKMDYAILKRLLREYNIREVDESLMPMVIKHYGNTASASVGIVYDMVIKGKLDDHKVNSGDYICFCSVGAGMFINSIIYKVP